MGNHVIKRGNKYHYVSRVPADLLHLFPSSVISKSLHTSDRKHATLLGISYKYKAKQLFTQLRTGMFDKTLQRLLVNLFLREKLDTLESVATGQVVSKGAAADIAINEGIIKNYETRRAVTLSDAEKQDMRANIAFKMAGHDKASLATGDTWILDGYVDKLAKSLKTSHGVNITAAQKKTLAREFTNASLKTNEAETGNQGSNCAH